MLNFLRWMFSPTVSHVLQNRVSLDVFYLPRADLRIDLTFSPHLANLFVENSRSVVCTLITATLLAQIFFELLAFLAGTGFRGGFFFRLAYIISVRYGRGPVLFFYIICFESTIIIWRDFLFKKFKTCESKLCACQDVWACVRCGNNQFTCFCPCSCQTGSKPCCLQPADRLSHCRRSGTSVLNRE